MYQKLIAACAAIVWVSISATVWAHHSFAAEFDGANPISVQGVVTDIKWTNPHTWFYLDVKDDNGNVEKWGFEGGTPTGLIRNGIKRDFLKVGDRVTMKGFRARDLSRMYGAVREIILADGRVVTVGPSDAIDHGIK